jgi:hypothetical protein
LGCKGTDNYPIITIFAQLFSSVPLLSQQKKEKQEKQFIKKALIFIVFPVFQRFGKPDARC